MSAKIFKCFKCGELSNAFQTDTFNVGGKEMKGVVCPNCGTVLYLLPEVDAKTEAVNNNGSAPIWQ